jgi:hypothetical protein
MTAPVPTEGSEGIRLLGMGSRSDANQLSHVAALVDRGPRDPHVSDLIGLSDVQALHQGTPSRHGKVLIDPTN